MKKLATKYKLLGLILLGWLLTIPVWIIMLRNPRTEVVLLGFAVFFLIAGMIGYKMWRMTNPTPETLNAPRNLLTHRDETVVAMMKVENPVYWLVFQRDRDPYSLNQVIRELEAYRPPKEETEHEHLRVKWVVKGSDGSLCWGIRTNGEVVFLRHDEPTFYRAARAKELGFQVAQINPVSPPHV